MRNEPGEPFDPMDDPMAPPREPCECWCMHCRRTFMSSAMWFQRVLNAKDGFTGFWMCPTPNCSGAGFTFDIFPTDPDHPANEGWHDSGDDEEFDEEFEEDDARAGADWDPDESKYKELDEAYGEEDEDIVGEEWKYGLPPGAEPPEPPWAREARERWEKEQERYEMPDERPRELDWSNRDDGPSMNEDDIPF